MKHRPGKNRPAKKTPEAVTQMIRRAKRMAEERVFAYGCSTVLGVQLQGFESLFTLVPKQWGSMVQEHVKSDLILVPKTWRLWCGVFAEYVNGDRKVFTSIADLHNLVSSDVEAHIGKHVMALQDDALEVEEPIVVGYGWVATTSKTLDLEGAEERNINFFEALDIYNVEKYKETLATAKLKELVKEDAVCA